MIAVAVRQVSTVVMGGVQTFVSGNRIVETDQDNLVSCGNLLLGCVCDVAELLAIRRLSFNCPAEPGKAYNFAVEKILPALWKAAPGVQALATWDDYLFVLSGGVVLQPVEPFFAIGDGADFATGVLAVTIKNKADDRVKASLEIAARYVPTIRGPFVVKHSVPFRELVKQNGERW